MVGFRLQLGLLELLQTGGGYRAQLLEFGGHPEGLPAATVESIWEFNPYRQWVAGGQGGDLALRRSDQFYWGTVLRHVLKQAQCLRL